MARVGWSWVFLLRDQFRSDDPPAGQAQVNWFPPGAALLRTVLWCAPDGYFSPLTAGAQGDFSLPFTVEALLRSWG